MSERLDFSPIKDQVDTLAVRRQSESEGLKREGKTLHEILQHFDNDYSVLDRLYEERVGVPLISDPYEAAKHPIPISKTCSIVIPAYNTAEQLTNTLNAIQASTFNAKYPQKLEVVIVDDGSPRVNIAAQVRALGLEDLTVKVFRQSNGRENKGRYSGALQAIGDIVIFTAQDTVYSPTMIEEYMKRHEVLGDIVSFAFLQQVDSNDMHLRPESIADGSLNTMPYDFKEDRRVRFAGMRDSEWLKQAGNNMPLPIDVEDDNYYGWTVPSIAWGFSVSAPREAFIRTFGGYDPGYKGYGGDDEHMVSDLIAEGMYVIPNTGGIAYHQKHPSRWDGEEAAINRGVWQDRLRSPVRRQDPLYPEQTDAALQYEIKNPRSDEKEVTVLQTDFYTQARTLLGMGLYEKAIESFNHLPESNDVRVWHDKAMALTKLGGKGNVEEAIKLLETAVENLPGNAALCVSLAVAYGRLDSYEKCLENYTKALQLDPDNIDAQLIFPLDGDEVSRAEALHDKATLFLSRGKPGEAMIYYEAALAIAGKEITPWSLFNKGVALSRLGQYKEAIDVLIQTKKYLAQNPSIDQELGLLYEKTGDIEKARALEKDSGK